MIRISKVKTIGLKNLLLKNQIDVAKDINRILAYSARKIIANKPPLNSMLKPDTISDSPSAKSKGARFVSATLLVNHTNIIGIINSITGYPLKIASLQEVVTNKKAENRSNNNSLTSYEIV